jgi:hypothetical protein
MLGAVLVDRSIRATSSATGCGMKAHRDVMPHRLAGLARIVLALFAVSCSTPEVAPAVDVDTPVGARSERPTPEDVQPKAPPSPEPTPSKPSTSELVAPEPTPTRPVPWGSPLRVTGNSRGLRWTTTAQVERTAGTLQLALDVELHNSTRAAMKVSLHPPLALVMTTSAPGSTGEGLGLGMRGEGMGSDACSPGHGGPAVLRPGDRATAKRTVELDPLPWPPGQALRVTATSSDCRKGRLSLEVLDVRILQPATPDGVPTLMPTAPSSG